MARTVTLANLRTWSRRLSDTEGDPNITDAELTDSANWHITDLWDELGVDYYAASATIGPTTPGTESYPLPADFSALLDVFANETTDQRRPVLPMGEGQRGRYKAPTGVWTFTIEYLPAPPVLADGGPNTFDAVSGWDELIANLMARDVMKKREADLSGVLETIGSLRARINSKKKRNKGQPKRIVDLDAVVSADWPWGWSANIRIAAYRLRGSNLELFEPLSGLP